MRRVLTNAVIMIGHVATVALIALTILIKPSQGFTGSLSHQGTAVPAGIFSHRIPTTASIRRAAPDDAAKWCYGTTRSIRRLHSSPQDGQIEEPQRRRPWENEEIGRKFNAFKRSTRFWMGRILQWQRQKRKSLVAAAALALSLLMVSSGQIDSVYRSGGTSINDGPNVDHRPPIELVQQRSHSHATITSNGEHVAGTQLMLPRGGGGGGSNVAKVNIEKAEEAVVTTTKTFKEALIDLQQYMQGPKSDTLILLLATALITPLCQKLGSSPILGFLASGMLLGPNGWGLISGIHTTETLAELGIVFFLFEMGIELSFERLLSMRKDVFGLGFSQFIGTALAVAGVGKLVGLPANALVVLGGGLALSSSAFVLQLLKDKDQLATRFGKAAFGILLFQDLAVVPLLVVTPILAGGGGGLASAVGSAVIKAAMALGAIAFAGRVILNPLFKTVAQAQSQEAFLGVVLLTVLSMSFMTEGLGLSNTLGAFLAGVLLSETKYRYQIEADIAPFRGILLGLFFVTVGFEIDLHLIASNLPIVGSIVVGIILIKALIATALSLAFGLSLSTSQQTGLILSQGGEFAFVAFGLARNLGILDKPTTKLMLTSVSLTMALTPFLATLGGKIAKKLEEKSDFTHYLGQDRDASEIKESDDFAVIVGYGAVGKVVCDLLDRKFIKYVGLEIDPNKAIEARNRGLPVFYGDIGRQEVAEAFNVGKAKAVIVCIAEKSMANRAVIALRRWYPDLKIFARAADADHASRLQRTLDVAAMVPILPEDNLLLTLPFGGAVLRALGSPAEEVNAILEVKRKEVLTGKSLEKAEEQMTLFQLGIDPAEKMLETEKKKEEEKEESKASSEDKPVTESKGDEKEDAPVEAAAPKAVDESKEKNPLAEAAAARMGESKEKSPFVASVIGEVCPDSKSVPVDAEEDVAVEIVEALTAAPALQVIDVEVDTSASLTTEERNTTNVES